MKNPPNPVILWSKISPLLNNPSGPCSLSLKAGLVQRADHPLPSGLYKLRDAKREISRNLEEFQLLARLLQSKQPLRGNCTYGDHALWVKKWPTELAFELGWKVLPSIEALVGDGISDEKVKNCLPGYFRRIANLVNQCEVISPQITGPIGNEYKRWRNKKSLITPLFETALGIIESALDITKEDTFA